MKKQFWILATAIISLLAFGCENQSGDTAPNGTNVHIYRISPKEVNLGGWEVSFKLIYQTDTECDVVIPDEAKDWISIEEPTRVQSDTLTVVLAANNSGTARSAIVKVVAANQPSHAIEYTITQNRRYTIHYTSINDTLLEISDTGTCGVKLYSNTYKDGIGSLDFYEPITKIGYRTFYKQRNLKSIIIPESVVEIGEEAFRECINLEEVTIPDGVTKIEAGAFRQCSSLTSVKLPGSINTIPDQLFTQCSLLTEMNIPQGVTSIGLGAFLLCENLRKVTIPDGVTIIDTQAFEGCKNLKDVVIPGSVDTIGSWAFRKCTYLNSVTIGEGLTTLGNSVFYECLSMQKINLPSTIANIGTAFFNCAGGELEINTKMVEADCASAEESAHQRWLLAANFHKFTFGENIEKIGDYAFCGDMTTKRVKELVFNGKIKSIGKRAFYLCCELEQLTLPESVTSIGSEAFYNCLVRTLYCRPTTPPSGDVHMFSSVYKIYVPRESVDAYLADEHWGQYARHIEGYDFE